MDQIDVKALFGQRVRQLRKSRGWSQEDFAHHVGLDRSYMGGVERGERNISLENIYLIAQGLEIPPAELFLCWSDGAARPNAAESGSVVPSPANPL